MLRIASIPGFAVAAIILASIASPASAAGSPLGVWIDEKGRGAVEISQCDKALCGKVVWVKSTTDSNGCGAQIIGGVKPAGRNTWDYGWIYSPDHGRKFDVALTPVGTDSLRVTGYAGIKLLSESHTWKRAPADLPRCDSGDTAAKTQTEPAPVATTGDTKTKPSPGTSPVSSDAQPDSAASGDKTAAGKDAPAAAGDQTIAGTEPANDGIGDDPASRGAKGNALDKVLKKTADGRCKLDLPWLKIDFSCKNL